MKRRKRTPHQPISAQVAKNIPRLKKLKLWFLTLFYHYSFNYDYVVDTLLEPLFWIVDHLSQSLGKLFVSSVVILVSSIVVIAHVLGIPFWTAKSPELTGVLAIIGYWNLTNLVFNFYKVATVCPGMPTDQKLLAGCTVTVCKKCINPKPPRTHHCSICNRCFLNMDHHCREYTTLFILSSFQGNSKEIFCKLSCLLFQAWVNNCVGHYNRRYFFLCMFYIVNGCLFIMLFGVELAFRQIILDQNVFSPCFTNSSYFSDELLETAEPSADVLPTNLQTLSLDQGTLQPSPSLDSSPENVTVFCEKADEAHLWLGWVVTKQAVRLTIFYAGFLCVGELGSDNIYVFASHFWPSQSLQTNLSLFLYRRVACPWWSFPLACKTYHKWGNQH